MNITLAETNWTSKWWNQTHKQHGDSMLCFEMVIWIGKCHQDLKWCMSGSKKTEITMSSERTLTQGKITMCNTMTRTNALVALHKLLRNPKSYNPVTYWAKVSVSIANVHFFFFLVSVHVENETFFWANATNTTTLFGARESHFNREKMIFKKWLKIKCDTLLITKLSSPRSQRFPSLQL